MEDETRRKKERGRGRDRDNAHGFRPEGGRGSGPMPRHSLHDLYTRNTALVRLAFFCCAFPPPPLLPAYSILNDFSTIRSWPAMIR